MTTIQSFITSNLPTWSRRRKHTLAKSGPPGPGVIITLVYIVQPVPFLHPLAGGHAHPGGHALAWVVMRKRNLYISIVAHLALNTISLLPALLRIMGK